MKNHRTHPRLRQRRLTLFATFVAVLALASGSVVMAATGYARMQKAATQATSQAPITITVAPGCWQPPGCVFPATTTFAGR